MPSQVKAKRLQGPTMPESLCLYHFFVPELPGPQSAYGGKHTKSAMLELCFTHPVDWQCISDAQRVEALLLTNPAFQHLAVETSQWQVWIKCKDKSSQLLRKFLRLVSFVFSSRFDFKCATKWKSSNWICSHFMNAQTCGYRKNGTAADISISFCGVKLHHLPTSPARGQRSGNTYNANTTFARLMMMMKLLLLLLLLLPLGCCCCWFWWINSL